MAYGYVNIPRINETAKGGHIAQEAAPDNTNLLWIDAANGNVLKFYDPEAEAWKPVGAAWG